ncbi:hypothetical protein A2335_02155 [Candidatus Peregrinibacteria bacterium RIFOXYB2_FULL_32_7]|nr:MAG: hypothetical protein A2335_02155 [Candidatus Peregrinibacteria bacterium RIFOXYB2_FULL_32_7]
MYLKINQSAISLKEASTFFQRFLGLSYKRNSKFALLFKNTKCVHTFGMFFQIHLLCLNQNFEIIKIKTNLKPFRIFIAPKGTKHIIEIPSNLIKFDNKNSKLKIDLQN